MVVSRMPRRAPELLARIARRGAAGMPHVGGGAGKPLLPTLGKSEERRKQAASGWPFLWILSFKYLACRCENRLLNKPSRQRHKNTTSLRQHPSKQPVRIFLLPLQNSFVFYILEFFHQHFPGFRKEIHLTGIDTEHIVSQDRNVPAGQITA